MWEIEYTDGFFAWWETLTESEQDAVSASVEVLRQVGPALSRPRADVVHGSRHANMKELRTQHRGRPIRAFFAFDPRRTGILLIGGDKTGDDRFYDRMVPLADQLYDDHLAQLRKEGWVDLMARNFREIEATLSADRLDRIRATARRDMQDLLLSELRKHAGRTAQTVAADLGVDDATLAKLEIPGDDMPISTLRRLVEALGGELDFVVHLPDRDVRLSHLAAR